jgi:hypothetical protein
MIGTARDVFLFLKCWNHSFHDAWIEQLFRMNTFGRLLCHVEWSKYITHGANHL